MANMLHQVFVGQQYNGENDPLDVFGAHVGITLGMLCRLRAVRADLERIYGRSMSLLDALDLSLRTMQGLALREATRVPEDVPFNPDE